VWFDLRPNRRPSVDISGFGLLEDSPGGKWLQLLSEIAPGLKRAAILFNPDTSPASAYMPSLEAAARSLKVVPIIAPVHSDGEIETAIIALGREPGAGLVVVPDTFTAAHRAPIISAAARNNVPAVYGGSEFARDGGLLSYGPDFVDNLRRAATIGGSTIPHRNVTLRPRFAGRISCSDRQS
jgi:putative ABC transport system substrate-binding protein